MDTERRCNINGNGAEETMPGNGKTHAITFRLGAREYEQLLKTMAHRGSRSLSEFTRSAVLSSIVIDGVDQFLKEELDLLMSTLDEFDTKVRDLRRQLRQLAMKSSAPTN
jgi:hypothetical protein